MSPMLSWPVALVAAAALAVPPTARQAAEDEALVRRLVEARLAPLVEEWRTRAGEDANLAARLELALLEIRTADGPAADRLAGTVPVRRALVAAGVADADPRRAAWALDLATDLLVAGPAIDGRVATMAVGIADPESIERWRGELAEAEAALAAAETAIAATPRGPLALPDARSFRRGWEGRAASLAALANGTRALLDGAVPAGMPAEVPPEPEWNDLALLSALAAGSERLRALAADSSRGSWINLAAECGLDLAAGDGRGRMRLADRAAALARGPASASALLAADAAVRAAPSDDPARFAPWETLLDATPAARRGPLRAAIVARFGSLPPSVPVESMGDLELGVRSLAEPMPAALAAEVVSRASAAEGSPREAFRLLDFARLRVLVARGQLGEAAALAGRLAETLGDDPIAAASAETLVLVRSGLANASTDEGPAREEREALAFATGRFPRHPRHDRWAIDLAIARLDAGDAAAALAATRLVPDGRPLDPEARAVEAIALVRLGDEASLAAAESIARRPPGGDPVITARVALANGLRQARAGRIDEARATVDAVLDDASLPAPLRADAMKIALELGTTPSPVAARAILAAHPRARGAVVEALRTTTDEDRRRRLLEALAGSLATLTPAERLVVAEGSLAAGDAEAAARLAAETVDANPRGSPAALAAMLVRAEALRSLGGDARLGEAFSLGREVVRQAPSGSPTWWSANALQLEILEGSGRNRDQVIPWVNRLRAIDLGLGGAATRARIETVAKRADG